MVGAGKVWKGFIFFILSERPSPEMVKGVGPILLVKISYLFVPLTNPNLMLYNNNINLAFNL